MKTEIERFEPCADALEFRRQYATFEEAWAACPRGDWMLWIAKRLGVDLRVLLCGFCGFCGGSYAEAKKQNQQATADICRKYLTEAVMEKIKAL